MKSFKQFLMEQSETHLVATICSHPESGQHRVKKIDKYEARDKNIAQGMAYKHYKKHGYHVHGTEHLGIHTPTI